MHIAQFTNTYKPNINGVARSVSAFREALTDLGHNVFVFAQQASDYEDAEPFIFRYPALQIPGFDYSAPIPVSPFVTSLLPSLKLDVLHSNHPLLLGSAAAQYAEDLDLPLVFTFHTQYVEYADNYMDSVPISNAFVEGILVEGLMNYLQRCQHIITPGSDIKKSLEELGGITSRITTIPTGIDLAPYQKADGENVRSKYDLGNKRVLVCVGRFSEEKNLNTLLEAVGQVMGNHADVRLLLIGDGPQRDDLEAQADKLGIANKVIFTGSVPFDEIPNYLKASDIFCFPSVTETQGLVTLEAMAAGLPVVAVDAPGTNDVVEHGKEGLLTDNQNTALANAIEKLLGDDQLFKNLAQQAVEKAKSLDINLQAQKMQDVYSQAIEDKRANQYVEVDLVQVDKVMEERKENAE